MRPPRWGYRVAPDPVGVRFACPGRTGIFLPGPGFSPGRRTAPPVRPRHALRRAPSPSCAVRPFSRYAVRPSYAVHPSSPEASTAQAFASDASFTAIIGV
ncbi:hypothetical protein JCM4814A_22390 [Streptomyces phaeofaciens JCM 4814]|uniref:Uncharacterized protein n=1 Tax=Streptomyces phaeofaciens TaxID=68254 RepID=A0A918LPC7_9ACTN|nr:hypothetical protein GCM10010226_07740 [Streptomyces phaeofaciens]